MKILFFSPHAETWGHAFPEALVAEALAQGGHQIVYVGCGGAFERYCVPMSSHGMTPTTAAELRHQVCQRCGQRDALIRRRFGLRGPTLTELIDDNLRREADEMVSGHDRKELIALECDGIQIGRIALYQLMLRKKRLDTDLSDDDWSDYLVELRNTISAWQAGKVLLDREKPDRLIVYNALYSVHRVVCKLAESRGIPHFFLHAGGNLSNRLETLWIGRGDTFSFFPHIIAQWPRFAELACNAEDLATVTDHYLELLRGRSAFVYSRPKSARYFDVRKFFGVKPEQKLLVATLGSYDEEKAAEAVGARVRSAPPLFETQIDWVKALVAYATRRPDIFLVVRVHPREFPNKREGVLSRHALQMKEVFSGFPANVVVNWPDDEIAMYDLADQTDVFLNSWSSVGQEMALLGVPVVLYAPELAFYPSDLGYVGTTKPAYFAAIEQALADGWSFERVRCAYRWYAFAFIHATAFIGDSFPKRAGGRRTLQQRVVEQIDRRFLPEFEPRWDAMRRRPALGAAQKIRDLVEKNAASFVELMDGGSSGRQAIEEETAVIGGEVERIATALYPTLESRTQSRLYRLLSRHGNVATRPAG